MKNRESLIEEAFLDIPQSLGCYRLRPLSGGSFALLGRIKNVLLGGGSDVADVIGGVAEYVWIHSADLAVVSSIQRREQLPLAEISAISYSLSLPECMAFVRFYQRAVQRMSAALVDLDDDDEPGKPEPLPTGSPASSSASVLPETLPGNATSSGNSQSSELMPISTRSASPTEQPADGRSISPTEPGEILPMPSPQ